MGKTEFANLLRDHGYKTEMDSKGCVMAVVPSMSEGDKIIQLATENGYVGSYGWRMKRKEE